MNIRKLQWSEVAPKLKAKHPGRELHHVFGRRHRLLACQRFIVALTPDEHRGPDYGKLTVEIRDKHREMAGQMGVANQMNRDPGTCWWKTCIHSGECPLYRRACAKDAKEMAKMEATK